MSIPCHTLLLASAHALLLSCASRPELARSQPSLAEVPRSSVQAEQRVSVSDAAVPSAANPYVPTRSLNAAVYSWQSEKRAECTPEASLQNLELERPFEPNAARGVFAALPERTSNPGGSGKPRNPDLVVAGLRPALHHCFSRWVDDRLDAQGSVRFTLELGCAGEVEAISAENRGIDERTLECLFSAVAPARFAPPAAGHATVFLPVVFKNAH